MRTDSGLSAGHSRPDGFKHFERKPQPVFDAAAIRVGAEVGQRREERCQQIAVCHVQLEHIEARLQAESGRAHELLPNLVHVRARHFDGQLADTLVVRNGRGRQDRASCRPAADDPSFPSPPAWSPCARNDPAAGRSSAGEWLCTNSTIRCHASRCASFHKPVQPGVIRPSGETQVISV